MDNDIKKIFEDKENNFYPSDENAFDKLKCKETQPGQKISWYYKDDLEYVEENEEEDFDIKDDPPFSGMIAVMPDVELYAGNQTDLESDDCIVIVTDYPAEKEYCRCGWISLHRLLDQENLIEIF